MVNAALVVSITPVSYTHLDVYKRQILCTDYILLQILFKILPNYKNQNSTGVAAVIELAKENKIIMS